MIKIPLLKTLRNPCKIKKDGKVLREVEGIKEHKWVRVVEGWL